MTEAIDPDVQAILDELPGALGDATAADTAIRTQTTELDGLARRERELQGEQSAAASGVAADHASRVFGTYEPKLQHLMKHVLAGGEDDSTQTPSLEDCERIFAVDGLIHAAAGQPVVVVRPDKPWIDVGMLKAPHDRDFGENTGLQLAFHWRNDEPAVVLPVHDTVTIELATAREPSFETRQGDEELQRRNRPRRSMDQDDRTQPAIDPLHTAVILPGVGQVGAETAEADPPTAHVLVGYDFVQKALNRVLGFDFDETDELEAAKSVSLIDRQKERLTQAGLPFDPDFIDGYLAYRIEMLEREMSVAGPYNAPSKAYQQAIRQTMRNKFHTLVEEGWIAKPSSWRAAA